MPGVTFFFVRQLKTMTEEDRVQAIAKLTCPSLTAMAYRRFKENLDSSTELKYGTFVHCMPHTPHTRAHASHPLVFVVESLQEVFEEVAKADSLRTSALAYLVSTTRTSLPSIHYTADLVVCFSHRFPVG